MNCFAKGETEGTATGGRIVDDFGHEALVLAEVEFVTDTDFTRGIDNHVPEALLAVQLAEQIDLDAGSGLLLIAIETGREYLGVVEYEGITFIEVVENILENTVLNLTAVLVKDHQFAFITPAYGLGSDFFLGEIERELREFHNTV